MFKLIFCYYKGLFLLNLAISICLGLLCIGIGSYGFPICFLTGGYFISILYYENSKQNQYYFYYNRGLSKQNLYITSLVFNTIFGLLFIFIIKLCKIYLR